MEVRKEEPKIHCTTCDKLLTDYEATRKNAHTFNFIDLCKTCFEDVKPFVSVLDRRDLITEQDLDTIDDEDDLCSGVSLDDVGDYIYYVDSYEDSRDYDV